MFLKAYLKPLSRFINKIFPTKTISSFFGIGYLPTWQNHWCALLALIISYILFYLIYGSTYINSISNEAIEGPALVIAVLFLKIAIFLLALSIIAIFTFQANYPQESSERIVIHIALAQILMVAFAMPAIISIYYFIISLYDKICNNIFYCSYWFNQSVYFAIFFIIPYIYLNIVECIKPWPISFLQLNYNNFVSMIIEVFVYVFYALIFIYLTAFIFFDLTITNAMIFNHYVINFINII